MKIEIMRKEIFLLEEQPYIFDEEHLKNKVIIMFKYNKKYYVHYYDMSLNFLDNIDEFLKRASVFTKPEYATECFDFYKEMISGVTSRTIDHVNNKDDLDYLRFK